MPLPQSGADARATRGGLGRFGRVDTCLPEKVCGRRLILGAALQSFITADLTNRSANTSNDAYQIFSVLVREGLQDFLDGPQLQLAVGLVNLSPRRG